MRSARLVAPVALTLALAPALSLASPGPAHARSVAATPSAAPALARVGATSVLAAQPIPTTTSRAPSDPSTRTGPGVGEPAKHDALASRVVQGLILILVAAAVVGWIFRARVRDWMVGRSRR